MTATGEHAAGTPGTEVTRMVAVLVWVTGATAVSLGALGALPDLLGTEPREVRSLSTVEEAERWLGASLALPSYYPARLAWPPAEVRVAGGRGGAASLAFRAQHDQGPSLLLLQATTPGVPIPPALLQGARELASSRTHLDALPVVRARVLVEGVAWEELRWERDGRALVLRSRGDLDELVRLARSVHRRGGAMSQGAQAGAAPRGAGPGGRAGIRRRVYLLMAVGIAFPLLLMVGVGWYLLRAVDERVVAGRVASTAMAATHFDGEMTGDLEILQRLAAAVGPGLSAGDEAAAQRAVQEAFAHFRHREAVFLLDGQRRLVAEAPRGRASTVAADAGPVLDEAQRSGLPRLSGLIVDGHRGAVIHQLVPVRDYAGAVVGLAGGSFDPAHRGFERMLGGAASGPGSVAELVDADGRVIASSAPRRTGRTVECAALVAAAVRERRAGAARTGECGAEEGGPWELVTYAPLASAPWLVLTRQPLGEAIPSEGSFPWLVLLAALGAHFTLATVFAWGAARSVTQPLAVLTAEAERIASGELSRPIAVSSEDEVARLGQALDGMRLAIKELVERVEGANTRLEERVRERTAELARANEALREREEVRADLLRKVITAQEDERKRVARELHDETTQSLAVLIMRIDRAAEAIRAGQDPGLEEVKVLATWALDDVHRLILDLRPGVLDDLGLLSAIRWNAERTLRERGVAVRCEFGELARLPPELETAAFRMCQEAMSNIARHAQATQVLVEVSVEGQEIHVTIEDDGKGFDQAEVARRPGRPHWGLLGIGERAELLGGRATIDSTPGAGTRVDIRIPLPREAT